MEPTGKDVTMRACDGIKFLPSAFEGESYERGCMLVDDDQFYRIYVQYVLLVTLDVSKLVQFRPHLTYRASQFLAGKHPESAEVLWCAISLATEKFFKDKAHLHLWSAQDEKEMKLQWLEFMALAFVPTTSQRRLEKSAIDAWVSKFRELNKRSAGPLELCGPCTSKCQYQYEATAFIKHSIMQNDFDIEIEKTEKPKDELLATFVALQTMRLAGRWSLDLSYCIGAHLLEPQRLTSDDKKILISGARIRLEEQSKTPPKPTPETRKMILDAIVQQALLGAPWREICVGLMEAGGITPEEVEAEIATQKK